MDSDLTPAEHGKLLCVHGMGIMRAYRRKSNPLHTSVQRVSHQSPPPPGHEKLLRIFDVEKPESPPQEFPAAEGPIRCVVWTKDDATLLTSDLDKPNIT